MKIVYSVANIENSGGIERVICTKANFFADVLGYEVHIITLQETKNAFFPFSDKIELHSLGIDTICHKSWMILGSKSKKEYQKKLFQKLEEIKPDVTISVFGLDAEFLYKAKDGSQKVLEFHFTKNYLKHLGDALVNDRWRLLRKGWLIFLSKREEYYVGKYRHVVLLTEKDKQLWGRGDRFTVIPNPLSFTSSRSAELENKVIVAIGRYMPQKGFDLLIHAFSLLQVHFPDWKLCIYGEGQERILLQDLINKFSLQHNVFLKSPQKDIYSVMLDASLFVFPSRYEGFGLVLIEAMECGLPCVAFDCECGPSEIITEGQDGFLVELCNVEQMVEKMKVLINDEMLRKKMGKSAKENVKRFGVDQIMEQWKSYLQNLIS